MNSTRPQNKNLIDLRDRPAAEAHAIRSAGGRARQAKLKKQRALATLLTLYSEMPIKDGRIRNRLLKLGVPEDELTQKFQIADALLSLAKAGNTRAIALYLDIIGDTGVPKETAENNLFEMIEASRSGSADMSDIHEFE
ncbi:MAG: hypothetical protein J5994_08130 [Ruminococcus sp.]|nr:hypothetical protein [Ruminococcus sp.]